MARYGGVLPLPAIVEYLWVFQCCCLRLAFKPIRSFPTPLLASTAVCSGLLRNWPGLASNNIYDPYLFPKGISSCFMCVVDGLIP